MQRGWAKRALLAIGGILGLLLALGLAMSIGEVPIPLATTYQAIANKLFGTRFPLSAIEEGIVWDYRLCRAIVASCCGGALAVCGAILQALLRNTLAEPYVLGVSAGASTGAVAVMILGLGAGLITIASGAFIGAILAFLLIALLAAGAGGGSDRIILAGIAGSQLFNAATSYIVASSASAEQARGVMFWLLGSLGGIRWSDVYLAAPVAVAGIAISLFHARALDAFTFGTDAAAALGIDVRRVRLTLFLLTALLTAAMVGMVGCIGFVGLVVPHGIRLLVGPLHSRLLPFCLLAGALIMVLADIVSRVILPQQVLPIGVVTALVGAPVFAILLYRTRRSA